MDIDTSDTCEVKKNWKYREESRDLGGFAFFYLKIPTINKTNSEKNTFFQRIKNNDGIPLAL